MRPGLPNASGVSVHATWKQLEFGFGPYATTRRRSVSIGKDVRRARATFDDAIRTGVDMTNPFSDPESVALVGLLRQFLDDGPAYRSDPADPSVVLRLLRVMNLRDHKEAAFAYHITSQLQRGARVCTTNLPVRVSLGTRRCRVSPIDIFVRVFRCGRTSIRRQMASWWRYRQRRQLAWLLERFRD